MPDDRLDSSSRNERASIDKLPNLLILGAAKSGTSSLYRYLDQHPDIFMSPFKEPSFFVWQGRSYDIQGPSVHEVGKNMVTELDSYIKLFSNAEHESVRGEASTGYLHTEGVPERIKQLIPQANLMAILRNPIDRAYSAFLHARLQGFEPLSDFRRALNAEPERIEKRWIGLTLYVSVGQYAEQLRRYRRIFPAEQMRIYLFDDLARDPLSVTQDAFRFLKVSDSFEPIIERRFNQGFSVRSTKAHSLIQGRRVSSLAKRVLPESVRGLYRRLNQRSIQLISTELRQELGRRFEGDLMQLARSLGRDLSPWLEGRPVPPASDGGAPGMHPT